MSTVLTSILDVFDAVGTWITSAVNSLVPMFYAESGLTFVGTLAVAGLAISVVFLLMRVITNFMQFRA